jgi:gliding motility-associated-like protein
MNMKKLALLFLLLSSLVSFSQLSNKHWIPPLHSRNSGEISDQYIYMSTNETTPFQVTATDGNGNPYAGSPFTISAATPWSFPVGTGQPTKMFLNLSDVNTVVSDKGVILEGPKDFYVSFRMRNANHAETIISKGRPGIGTSFRLGSLINETLDSRKNFVASVMATENNTTVTLSDYNTNVVFSSGTGLITADTQTFTLNAGQSIVFTGYCNVIANTDGMIGGLVTSNKPVAVNTGNALGGIDDGKADLTLDQIVSASQIGTDYIFIQGNGISTMENPLIVANENGTDIYINGSATPITTINAGQYYLVPNLYYQGTNNKNIYVRANKPVFAYQFLGGGSSTATSGLNFIPPLSCFFQNSVNLPNVNQIGGTTYTADLMILTYSNATITINGTAVPSSQAQAVIGNTDWVTYRVANQSGNLKVVSTGPLAVGVFGFYQTSAGFAGYYSGFGSTPQDTNVTICSNSTKDLFAVINGNPGTGGTWTVPSGGSPLNGNVFDPTINLPGEYIYTFTKSCNTALTTVSVKVNVTLQQIKNSGINTTTSSCVTTPPYDLFSLLGSTAEVGGTWSPVLTSGTGVFNPAINAGGIYTYSFPATGVCPVVSSTVTVNNSVVPIINPITDFSKCDDAIDGSATNGSATFDLTLKNSEAIGTQTGVNVTYHLNQNDADLGQNGITTINTGNRVIYVRLTLAASGCFLTTTFNLVVKPVQTITTQPLSTQDSCIGGTVSAFSIAFSGGLGNPSIQWYSNTTNDTTSGTAISGAIASTYTPPAFTIAGDYYYYAKVTLSGLDCGSVTSNTALVHVVADPTVSITPNTQIICQGTTPTDLVVTALGGVGTNNYQWFNSPANTAIVGATNASYTPSTSTVGSLSYYCEITQTGIACAVTSPVVNVQVVNNPTVSLQPLASQAVCINNNASTLTTAFIDGTGTPTYQWYSNTVNTYTGGTAISGEITPSYTPITTVVGTLYYYCIATYANGNCNTVSTTIAEVIVNPLPVINDITIVQCDDDLDAITSFNLTVNNSQISANAANETFTYYTSFAGANANPTFDQITTPLAFTNTTATRMYIWTRVTTVNGCYQIAKITLRVAAPNIPSNYNITLPSVCDDFLDINGNNNANNDDRDGVATFDFSSTEPTIRALLPTTGVYYIKYYRNKADALAQQNVITNLTNYRNIGYPSAQNIWVRVDSDITNACYGLGPWVTLNVEAKPFAHTVTIPRQCDDNTDGIFNFNTANLESDLLLGQTGVTVTYFDPSNNPLRDSNNNLITSPFPATFWSTSQTIRAVVTNATTQACWFDTTIQFTVDPSPIDFTIPASLTTECDDEVDPALQDGIFNFTNSQAIHDLVTFNQPLGMVYKYYDDNNVQLSTPLPNPLPVTLTKNIKIEVYNPLNPTCKISKTITFTVNPVPEIELETTKLVCSNNPTFFVLLDAGITDGTSPTNYTYVWSKNGVVIPTETSFTLNVNVEGTYRVKVINSLGCFRIRKINVIASNVANFLTPTIIDLSDNNTVIINAIGYGNYVYSLDYSNAFQSINIFTDVPAGTHTVYVKDLNGCGTSSQIINVIGIPKFFTPNADGFNDTWNVLGLTASKNFNTTIYIFDRYGKLIKELSPISKGWDGTFNGEAMPSDDYWYTIYFEDGRTEKGHFTLKR